MYISERYEIGAIYIDMLKHPSLPLLSTFGMA